MSEPSPAAAPLIRIQENWLAARERRLLSWICARLPRSVTPDKLTLTGLVGAAMVFAGYVASNLHSAWLLFALAGYVVQWFGDSLDGSLARFRKIERPSYGYFIDHSCDGLTNLLIVAGIGLSPFVTMDVAMLALAGYFLMSIHAFLSARVTGELKLSYIAAGPTELRLALMAMTVLMLLAGPGYHLGRVGAFDAFVGAIAALLVVLFAVQTLIVGRRLAAQEPARN